MAKTLAPKKKPTKKEIFQKKKSFDPVSRGAKPGVDHAALFKERVLAIGPDVKVAVLHDTDSDGICSGVLVAKSIERLRGKPVDGIIHQQHKDVGLTQDTIDRLKKQQIGILFVTDKAIDQSPETLKQASLFFKIIAFDHHQVEADLTDEMILIIKSQFLSPLDGAAYPTSKLVYDLFRPLVDITDLDWMSSAGIIADSCYPTWKTFVNAAMKKYGIKKKTDIFETDLGMVSRSIGNSILFDKKKIKEVVDIVSNARNPGDVLNSRLKEYEQAVNDEIEYWVREHKKGAQFFPELELVFYVVHPRYPINSPLSTILSKKVYPNQTLVVVHDSGDAVLGISLRRQDYKVHCPNLVKAAVTGLRDANGGGHIPAAGGKIRREDLARFLEQLKDQIASGNHALI